MDLDAAHLQDLEHLERRRVVSLDGRDDERVGLALVDLLDGVFVHLVEVEEQVFFVQGGRFDHALRKDELVIDEVPQPPPAAGPGIDKVHALVEEARLDLVRLDVDGAGDADRGRLAEDAEDVVEPGGVVAGADPPGRVGAAVDDAAHAVFLQVVAHLGADEVDAAPDRGLDIRQRRVHEGRHEETRAVGALLVLVDVDLRQPVVVEDLGHGPRFGQVEHVPVAVVVVAGVMVIEPGHIPAFELACPTYFRYQSTTIWLPSGLCEGTRRTTTSFRRLAGVEEGLARDEIVGQLHRHLGGCDLGRVEASR